MWERVWLVSVGGAASLLWTSTSWATCTMDNDCPGDSICEAEKCVAAPMKPLPAPVAPRTSVAVQPAPRAAPISEPIDEDPRARKARKKREKEERNRRRGPRHSTAMMVTGIVITSFAPIGLILAAGGAISGQSALFVGGFAGGGVACGVGLPLMIIGGRHEHPRPAVTARITPWLTPQGAGFGLRFEL
jgi:hypothetical protein